MRPGLAAFPQMSGRDLVLVLASELRSLRDLARTLPVTLVDSGRDGVMAAQGQDLLEQTLDELASFLGESAEAFGTEPLADLRPALGRVGLAALAARLARCEAAPAGPAPMAEAAGEMELL